MSKKRNVVLAVLLLAYFIVPAYVALAVITDNKLFQSTLSDSKNARSKGDYNQSILLVENFLKNHADTLNSAHRGELLLELAMSAHYSNQYRIALEALFEAENIFVQSENPSQLARVYNHIGSLYQSFGELEKATAKYRLALSNFRSLNLPEEVGKCLNNLAVLYLDSDQPETSLKYLDSSMTIWQQLDQQHWIAITRIHRGSAYLINDQPDDAIDQYQQAMPYFTQKKEHPSYSILLCKLGEAEARLNRYGKSIALCESGLELAVQIGFLRFQKDCCHCLYESHYALGNSAKALFYLSEETRIKDSVRGEDKVKEILRLEMTHVFRQRQIADSVTFVKQIEIEKAEIARRDAVAAADLRRKNLERNTFIGGFGLMLLLAIVFFSQRQRISREKGHSEELLLNILPEETARELKEKGSSIARRFENVSVLFTDFKEFTQISEVLSPTELVKDLHECFSEFDRICEKYGIEKIKTIGDAYMAAGGLPIPNNTHALDVVNAGLEMAAFIADGQARKQAEGLPFFEIRIGVHSGPVVAGIVGIKKFSYDIWGDTVNTASRMESSGAVGKVNVSQTTYELLKDPSTTLGTGPDFEFESRGEIEAKGKGKVKMYFVSQKLTGKETT